MGGGRERRRPRAASLLACLLGPESVLALRSQQRGSSTADRLGLTPGSWTDSTLCSSFRRDASVATALSAAGSVAAAATGVAEARRSQGSSSGGRPSILFHLHIPKAAGFSFDADIREWIGIKDSMMAYLSKEGCYEWVDCLPNAGLVTFLRNPREHVLSQYTHCKTQPSNLTAGVRKAMPDTFSSWVRTWVTYKDNGDDERDYAPNYGPEYRGITPSPWTRLPFKCYSPVNLQTQRLTCHQTHDYTNGAGRDLLALAKRNVRSAWVVGIVEAYEESMCLLWEQTYGDFPDGCDCSLSKDGRGRPPYIHNHISHNVSEHSVADVPDEILRLVDRLTDLDDKVYRDGVQRFVDDIRAMEERHGRRVLCDDTFNRLQPFLS